MFNQFLSLPDPGFLRCSSFIPLDLCYSERRFELSKYGNIACASEKIIFRNRGPIVCVRVHVSK